MKRRIASIILISGIFFHLEPLCAEERGRVITISQGIQMVLKDNRLIKVTLPDNEMAYQDSLVSRSALLPNLNVSAIKTYNQFQPKMKFGASEVAVSNKDPFSFGVDVYQTLFDFGKSLNYYRASKDSWKAAKAHTESVKRVAVLEFIVAYFDLLESEKMIEVAQKEVESLTSYLDDIGHLYEQGVVVKNDLLPAQVKLADAKQKLIAANNAREVIAARLNNILAISLREKIAVQDIKMASPALPEMEAAWKQAQEQRPEVAFYVDQIKASFSRERAKAVENFPVVYADGGFTYNQNQYQAHEDNASVNLGAKMNLYDGGLARAELLKERSRQGQLKEQKEKLIEDIKFEIEDSFFGLKNSIEKVVVSQDALNQADENVRFYRVKYNVGSATSTDVLEAITLQTRAQTNYYGADYDLKRDYAKLIYAMGVDLASTYEEIEKEKK
ncbi:MAG: TolC family protein [Candidatus Omnitrophica bacterium]|nr:TolC family protein [Candidatus Omnitrophota bacterium]MDD5652922.1 TolC family protein [Candidatus Omnitrophota bacterium]